MDKRPIRVLIVDGEDRFRDTTAAILERQSFKVLAVSNGLEALAEIDRGEFDVVILELKMPGVEGHETLREIKARRPDLPVIMLAGHGAPAAALESLREGVHDYLTKPCEADLLAQAIRKAYAAAQIGAAELSQREPRVKELMVPIASFSTVREEQTVADAIESILASYSHSRTTSMVQETVHRSVLVLGRYNEVKGIVTFRVLLRGLQPAYLKQLEELPIMAGSVNLESPHFGGMFTMMARNLAGKAVRELMLPPPPAVDAEASLMEAVDALLEKQLRRLLVVEGDRVVGVIREQDLVFALINVIKEWHQ